ncbi:hypothetical protein B0H11DRAFT_2229904 [Mycena galericulata]|nr:hypothetical protein B0H11DRAFT_2229904 [Mycena galericulata]
MSSRGSDVERERPPHMENLVDPLASAPDATLGGSADFLTARTSATTGDPVVTDSESKSSADHTASPNAPTGLWVKVRVDQNGVHYVYQTDTGLRFDISDDESVPTDTPYYAPTVGTYQHPNASRGHTPDKGRGTVTQSATLSSASDMQLTGSHTLSPAQEGTNTNLPGEKMLDTLFDGLHVHLSAQQKDQYSAVRGMLTTGRSALLTTTAFVAGQRSTLNDNMEAIERVRSETAKKLSDLHAHITSQEVQIDNALEENLRVLRAFGSTEEQLAHPTQSMAEYSVRSSPKPELPPLSRSDSRATTPLAEFQKELDNELPPRGDTEPAEAYYRRGANTVARRERMAATFAPGPDPAAFASTFAPAPSASAVHFAKTAGFDEVGSISTARARPYQTYTGSGIRPGGGNVSAASTAQDTAVPEGSHYETFHQDQENIIQQIAHREIGEVLNLPPHIRAKYRGLFYIFFGCFLPQNQHNSREVACNYIVSATLGFARNS